MPTSTVENYLKTIFARQGMEKCRVKTKELAEDLEISLPSVSAMIKSLAEAGLVDYQPYRGVLLTEEGRRAALRVIRNHRLIEVFLVQTLGYSWDEVHDEAERLEHAVSDLLAERIDEYLNFPRFDPHGDPIPTASGELQRREMKNLAEVGAGTRLRIERVLDQTPEVLRYLDRIGLRPGSELMVEEVLSFDGQMFLSSEAAEISISQSLAGKMLVTVLASPKESVES